MKWLLIRILIKQHWLQNRGIKYPQNKTTWNSSPLWMFLQEVQSLLLNWKGPDLTTYGELVLEGTFKVHRAKNERTLFLFDRVLLITKRRGEHYVYKTHISVRNSKLMHQHCLVVQDLVFRQVRGGSSAQAIKHKTKRFKKQETSLEVYKTRATDDGWFMCCCLHYCLLYIRCLCWSQSQI